MSLVTLPTFEGLSVVGIYKGYREVMGKPNAQGQSTSRTFVGISVETKDAYGNQSEKLFECVMPAKQIQKGLPALLAPLLNEKISLPVWAQPWQGAKSAGVTFYIADDVFDMFGQK